MGRKGKKKQASQEQGGPPVPSPGAPQDPQPSTSTTPTSGEKKQGPGSDEWSSASRKGTAKPSGEKPRPGGTRDQSGFQRGEQGTEERYQSGRGWERSGDWRKPEKETDDGRRYQHKPEESFSKSGGRYQQRGDYTERQQQQWSSDGQQGRPRGEQPGQSGGQPRQGKGQGQSWHDKGQQQKWNKGQQQWQGERQQWRGKGQEEHTEKQQGPSRKQQQWPIKEHEQQKPSERQQPKESSRPAERQYQSRESRRDFGGNVWQKSYTPEREDIRQKPQSPKIADDAPNVWQTKQVPEKDSKRGGQGQRVQGAPDKVHSPSSSTSPEPITALVPVYKKPGTLARKRIVVQSNHFALNLGNLKEAYHYDVAITEFGKDKKEQPKKSQDKDDKVSKNRRVKDKVQYRVVQEFLKKHFPDRYPSFDGKKNLYSSRPLKPNLNEVLTDTDITVIDDYEKLKTFSIVIQYVKTIDLVPQVQAGSSHPPMLTQNAIQCIDIVLRNAPIHCFNQIGASFFTKPRDRIIDLGGGMEMYYGFYQSVVMGGRPLLNVHLVHKAFPKNMPVLDAFVEILDSKDKRTRHTYQDLAALQHWQTKALNDYITTLKVAYEVPNSTKVIYRVNELVRSPEQEMMTHNGVRKTILEYFRTEKRYNIQYPNLPLLWVGNPKGNIRILVPPELCRIEKDQSVRRKMEDFQTSNMIREAATNTHVHRDNTMRRFADAKYDISPCVREFGFSVNGKFEEMVARILPPPQLQYGRGTANVNRGTWQNNRFLVAKAIEKWAILNVDRYVDRGKLESFASGLEQAARSCGVNIASRPVFDELQTRSRYGPTKTDLERYFKDQKSKNYDIIFVIIPSSEQGSNIYSYVKGAAEIGAGCLTQCVAAKTLNRFNFVTATNILLKVNGKLDGINHTFTPQCKPKLLQNRPVMIMGADVTHPPPQTGKGLIMPSVAAVIASHDPKAFQYNLCLRLQEPRMEYILDLKTVVYEQLMFYYKKNGNTKPEAIIFFRDGVSEGQFAEVLHLELKAIKDACKMVQREGYDPAITFLVVQKRHHTRLFPANDKDSEDQDSRRGDRTIYGNYNVPAGTCVDTTIVNPTMQNFYLVSHASIKGVSRPTKYCTLYDDLDMTNDEIEELSYYLCHMFARCNRSVSYPAPTYYAHLGALRGKAYIKPALDQNNFNMDDLQKEMDKIQIQFNIREDNPMFFI